MEQAVKVQSVTVLQSVAVPKYHWVIRINYLVRAISFAALFVAIGMHMASRGYGAVAWGLLALQFLAYPHLLCWRASSAREPLQAERTNLLLDCLLVGIWAAALEFPVLIAFTLFIGTSLNSAIYRGWRGALGALIAFSCGALGWVSIAGFSFSPYTDLPVSAFTLAGLSAYVIGIGNIVFTQNRKLHDTREELRKAKVFRLITGAGIWCAARCRGALGIRRPIVSTSALRRRSGSREQCSCSCASGRSGFGARAAQKNLRDRRCARV